MMKREPTTRPAHAAVASASRAAPAQLQALADAGRGARLAAMRALANVRGAAMQRASLEEEEPLHGKRTSAAGPVSASPVGATATPGGMPEGLRAGVESLSGVSLADVRVHHASSEPAQFGAAAFAQGGEVHLAAGRGDLLPHEAWHIVQQRQGRVRPNGAVGGQPMNDDPALELEADTMGARAAQEGAAQERRPPNL